MENFFTIRNGRVSGLQEKMGVTLSQEAYDALSEEKKNDGTIYFIPDGDGEIGIQDTIVSENSVWSSQKVSGEIAEVETELNAKLGEKADKSYVDDNFATMNKVDNIPLIYNQNTDILAYALTCPQEKRTLVRIYSANATNNPYGVSTDTDFIYEIDKINFNDLFITVRAKDVKNNREFINTKNETKWSGWKELATMNKVTNSIIRESRSVLYNLNNVDNIEVAIDIAKSGYKPIAVSLFNAGTHLWFAQGIYFNDTVCNLSLRGVAPSSATNAECKVLVTYIKTF